MESALGYNDVLLHVFGHFQSFDICEFGLLPQIVAPEGVLRVLLALTCPRMTFGAAKEVGVLVDNRGSLDKAQVVCPLEKPERGVVAVLPANGTGVVREDTFAGNGTGGCFGQTHAHSGAHTSLFLGQKKSSFSPQRVHPLKNIDPSQCLATLYAGSMGRTGDSWTLRGTESLELDSWHKDQWGTEEHEPQVVKPGRRHEGRQQGEREGHWPHGRWLRER